MWMACYLCVFYFANLLSCFGPLSFLLHALCWLCDVLCIKTSMGISFLSLLNKPQMPPRRANPNPNNNNNITPEMQQMMTAQTQLMQMMTTFIQNQNNNNNNNKKNTPPGFDMLTKSWR